MATLTRWIGGRHTEEHARFAEPRVSRPVNEGTKAKCKANRMLRFSYLGSNASVVKALRRLGTQFSKDKNRGYALFFANKVCRVTLILLRIGWWIYIVRTKTRFLCFMADFFGLCDRVA